MYVCLCMVVTDREIRSAVEDGTTSLCGLRDRLGCSGRCGKCAQQVCQIRDEVLAEMDQEPLPLLAAS